MIPYHFGIRLAVLASKKEIMDLENWLGTNLVTKKDAFYEVNLFCLESLIPPKQKGQFGSSSKNIRCHHELLI